MQNSYPLFTSGSIDPWHALSVFSNLSSSETAVFINGTAHCANMGPSRASDPPQLVQAREVCMRLIVMPLL